MDETTRNDIRRLLKVFGVQADEALMAHLDKHPELPTLRVRITLEDLTDYGAGALADPLTFQVEGEVRR